MKIVVIGAGLGGLTFAALAKQKGHDVVIYEKNSVPGGVVALAVENEYKFEQGPLLIGDMLEGEPVYEFLKSLGIKLETVRADRDSSFPDFKLLRPEKYEGPYWRKKYLQELFPEDKEGLDEYYKFYDDVMHLRYLSTLPANLFNKFRMALAFLKIKKFVNMSADELTRYFFKSEKLRAVYTAIFADFCADPNEVQGLGCVFTNFETAFDLRIPLEKNGKKYYPGFCYVVGGCQKIPESIAKYITDNGGVIKYNTIVEKVIIENNEVRGVRLEDGTIVEADVVVGCGAGKDFFENAVGLEHLTKEYREILENYRPMEAVFMLHLGVDYDPMQYLRSSLIYCYGTYDLHKSTVDLRNEIYHEGNDGYLIFVPSEHAKDFAPAGHHCITIYTIAPDKLKDGSWSERKEEYAEKLIHLAERELPNLSDHIVAKKIMTAEEYRVLTHMNKSSFGGNVPIMNLKTPSHVTPVKNLYFVGQQSENGGGLGAVISGAKDAFRKSKL